ncbi:MAG: adenosylcobalamin-dependent ribonucleoside-diphosphate reductase [Candidatus Liptonbacteria bacterium]|nr:adenosylcobalamin-dependent ribonucleoside-diphosphate reductase [Candidatus Liptonbacteria bacterium]
MEATTVAGLTIRRYFTKPGVDPFGEVEWVRHDAVLFDKEGKEVFRQDGTEFPKFWSDHTRNITAEKYFRIPRATGGTDRESSARLMISRVTRWYRDRGLEGGYFATDEDAGAFEAELRFILLHQVGSFNSPTWFNVGVTEPPQVHACFITSVEDTLPSILEWVKTEGMIFKGGSGSGTNLSRLRSSFELLSVGGRASGPVSFMNAADGSAGAIRSGGSTRRAAKLACLDIDHANIPEFIRCKVEEEEKARVLMGAGKWAREMIRSGRAATLSPAEQKRLEVMAEWDDSLDGKVYTRLAYSNANNSLRLSDEFMQAVEADGYWDLKEVTSGRVVRRLKARELLEEAALATWLCGDPGYQFDTTINRWNTCAVSGRIRASNPCSEYMHLDETACNLASLKLTWFYRNRRFDFEAFQHAVRIMFLAQEISIDYAGYPTPEIGTNAKMFREIGLGYADLGMLLMLMGLPYDSDAARAWMRALTAILTGEAYRYSAEIARVKGSFSAFLLNREPMLNVLRMHRAALEAIDRQYVDPEVMRMVREVWDEVVQLAEKHGVRNSQATVIAPTGTISFLMGCDTTGMEPELQLIKFKNLVGGGRMEIKNPRTPEVLENLGYTMGEIRDILAFMEREKTIEGAPHLKEEHLPVFDCSFRSGRGTRTIHWTGHIWAVAAVTPFLSGAASKTMNLPAEITPQEIVEAVILAWKLGVKAFAPYRDGSKTIQPLETFKAEVSKPVRRQLPAKRMKGWTQKIQIGAHEGYFTANQFPEDGQVAELFIRLAKEGTMLAGLLDTIGILTSIALQYGVPIKVLVRKLAYTRFEPSALVPPDIHPQLKFAHSVTDFIFRAIGYECLTPEEQMEVGILPRSEVSTGDGERQSSGSVVRPTSVLDVGSGNGIAADGPPCPFCGWTTYRNGPCYLCPNCAESTGCS